ncbi:MAG TPA: sigma-70 family RNA polymerase sigma factor [Candidatus Flavonifractor merdavium]|nr:sigma-70 family RNA polymerase sigma factor [Candidatus Flavonifractor merdavium]
MEKAEVLALIPRCLAGEEEARTALVLAVQNRIFYHCKKMLRNEDDALDATQEILIAMLTKLDSLKEPAAFWGWLSAMTANYCRNVLRRGGREVQIPEDEEGNSLLDTFETLDAQTVPDKAMDSAESRQMIMELIDNLPEAQRLCVLMYYYDEMGVKDIAAALDTSEGTIKSRLNYARKAIKEGVDRYAAQGVKLYGLAPLPFLAYLLKQDALLGGMTAAQSSACAQAALAGSSAALAGAAGTGSAGAAAGAAGSTGKAIASGILAHKGVVAAVAGVVLVGAIGGAAALSQPKLPAESPTPVPVMEVISAAPAPTPTPLAEPAATPTPSPTPSPTPMPTPTPDPTATPTPTPSPTAAPSPTPSPTPAPTPTPAPSRQPPQVQLRFTSYSGSYGENFGFPFSSLGGARTPFDGIVYTTTNPAVADVTENGGVALLSPGTATIIATFPEDDNFQVQIPVTVENSYNWTYQWAEDPLTISAGETRPNYMSQYGLSSKENSLLSANWSSSNPAVATVAGQSSPDFWCQITGVSAGSATITGVFTINSRTNVGMRPMTATASFQVTVS